MNAFLDTVKTSLFCRSVRYIERRVYMVFQLLIKCVFEMNIETSSLAPCEKNKLSQASGAKEARSGQ